MSFGLHLPASNWLILSTLDKTTHFPRRRLIVEAAFNAMI